MAKTTASNIKLGIFVISGAAMLILALYLIGNNQNLFGSRFRIIADFKNVNGLAVGNNVRFAGIDIGTVESIEIISDSSVRVEMVIEEKVKNHIKKNVLASVGTDGLMGNRLVNLNVVDAHAEPIENGDQIATLQQIETEAMMRTLNATNENIETITEDLLTITNKFKSDNSLWGLLMDSSVVGNMKQAMVNIRLTSDRTALITGDLSSIVKDVKSGKGTIGALLTDTTMSGKLQQVIVDLDVLSNNMALISGDLSGVSATLKNGEGSIDLSSIDRGQVLILKS